MKDKFALDSQNAFDRLASLIHDQPFDISNLEHDLDNHRLIIRTQCLDDESIKIVKRGLCCIYFALPIRQLDIVLNGVSNVAIDDRAMISRYTFETISSDVIEDIVTIKANENLTITVEFDKSESEDYVMLRNIQKIITSCTFKWLAPQN